MDMKSITKMPKADKIVKIADVTFKARDKVHVRGR
jgi:hypothetical protein